MNKKLYRDEYHRVLGGVCSGLADYFDMDVTIVRLLFAFAFFVAGVGLIPYIILWIVLPKKGFPYNNFNNPTVDYRVPPQQPAGDPQSTTPPPPSSQYGRNPFANEPYWSAPNSGQPMQSMPPQRQNSHAGIIVGIVLIVLGGIILVDNYDIIPDIDFGDLWPVIPIVVGVCLLVSGQVRHRQNNIGQNNGYQTNSSNNNSTTADEPAQEA